MSTISISELERLRAATFQGVWKSEVNVITGGLEILCDNGGPQDTYEVFDDSYPDEAACIIAEHNAIPVLLEIAKAGRVLVEAKNSNSSGDDYWRAFYAAFEAFRDALAKVAP